MSLYCFKRHGSFPIFMVSAESKTKPVSPVLDRYSVSNSAILPFSLMPPLKRLISSRVLAIVYSSEDLPIISSRVKPESFKKFSLTSTYAPDESDTMAMASGLDINAFWNFSSDSRSLASACLRSVISRLCSAISSCWRRR